MHKIKVHMCVDHMAGKQRMERREPELTNLVINSMENTTGDIIGKGHD